MENQKKNKIGKKFILIPTIVVIILLLIVIVTNVIFSVNQNKYQIRSYECCGELPPGMTIYAPCGCDDSDLTILQRTIIVLRGK